ncbi:MAG TPA: lipid ABC transporter permease/ATP-binding protein, partial [Burkholderiaceae bacterium]|nr:lipid ABC transporter permease/ATP-binding protein [Burkholderiaceae bacterium]
MKSESTEAGTQSRPVNLELWRRIYVRVGQYWKAIAVALVLVAISAATQPTLAIITKPLIDEGFTGAKPHYVWAIPLA